MSCSGNRSPLRIYRGAIASSFFGAFFGGVMAGLADEEGVYGHELIQCDSVEKQGSKEGQAVSSVE
jgi:hypothetical protein